MALTIVAQPQNRQQAYNPIVYVVSSDISNYNGFRLKVTLESNLDSSKFYVARISPDKNGNCMVDVSKILQSKVKSIPHFLDTNNTLGNNVTNTGFDITWEGELSYDITFQEEYLEFESFDDYEFVTGDKTKLTNISDVSIYSVGDVIQVITDSTYTDNRKKLNGYFTIIEVGVDYIVIDLTFTTIGSFPTTPGKIYITNSQYVTGVSDDILNRIVFNEALPFNEWPNFVGSDIIPNATEFFDRRVLTNMPAVKYYSFDGWSAEDEIVNPDKNSWCYINPKGRFMWNVYNNGSELNVFAQTSVGTKFIQKTDYNGGRMFQVDPSPNAKWLPSFYGNIPNYSSGFNFLNEPETGEVIDWVDIYYSDATGWDTADVVNVKIYEDGILDVDVDIRAIGWTNGRRTYEYFTWNGQSYDIAWQFSGTPRWIMRRRTGIYAFVAQMISSNNSPQTTIITPWTYIGSLPPGVSTVQIVVTDASVPLELGTNVVYQPMRYYIDKECSVAKINNIEDYPVENYSTGCLRDETLFTFRDRSGSYGHLSFKGKRSKTGDVQKQTYKSNIGQVVNGKWTYNTYDSEKTTFDSVITDKYTVNSGWVNQVFINYFEELITSPEVYVSFGDDIYYSCSVTDTTVNLDDRRYKKLINKTVQIEFNSKNPINV